MPGKKYVYLTLPFVKVVQECGFRHVSLIAQNKFRIQLSLTC